MVTCQHQVASICIVLVFLSVDVCPKKDLVKRGLTEPTQTLPKVDLTCIFLKALEDSSLL